MQKKKKTVLSADQKLTVEINLYSLRLRVKRPSIKKLNKKAKSRGKTFPKKVLKEKVDIKVVKMPSGSKRDKLVATPKRPKFVWGEVA